MSKSSNEKAFLVAWKAFAPGLAAPTLELKFHPKRRWRFDFSWPELKVAVEIHGATFKGGRHTTGKGFGLDREKMNAAQLLEWKVLEYTEAQLQQYPDRIVHEVAEAMGAFSVRVK